MITDLISMNGYGVYVWSAFAFTLIGFFSLYIVVNLQLKKEQKRFEENFSTFRKKSIKLQSIKRLTKKF